MKKILLSILISCLFAVSAQAAGPGQFSALTDEEYARLMDNTLSFDEIGNLVKYFNPTYRMYADGTDSQNNDLSRARDTFKEEMQGNIDEIDKNLDQIKKQRAELAKLPGTMIIDDRGTTAAQAIAQLDGTASMLKESRQQVKKALGQGSSSVTKILSQTEDSLRPVRDNIASVVEGLVISYQELLVNRELVAGQISLYEAMLKTQQGLYANNLAASADVAAASLNLEKARLTLSQLDNGIAKLRTAIGLQTGWSADNPPVIEAVPAPDAAFADSVNKEEDYQKALSANKTYENTGKISSYSGDSAVYQRDRAKNEADALASSRFETLYQDMKSKKLLYDAANISLERARLSRDKAQRMLGLGLIANAEYEGLCLEYLSYEANARLAALSLFQSINDYRWAVKGYMTY